MASSNDKPCLTLYELHLAFGRCKAIRVVMQRLAADPNPLFQDAFLREREPIAELLKGLSQSSRKDHGLLSLSEALDIIQFFLIDYRSPEGPDTELFRNQARKELDTFYEKTVELIFNIRFSSLLSGDSPLCGPDVAFAQYLRRMREKSPDMAAWAHPAVEKFISNIPRTVY